MEAMEAVDLWVVQRGPVDTSGPAGLSTEHAGHTEGVGEEAGLVKGTHVFNHLHAVHEDVVHSICNLCIPLLQVLEASGLLLVLVQQGLNVLPVDPNGHGRGPVQNVLQLKTDIEKDGCKHQKEVRIIAGMYFVQTFYLSAHQAGSAAAGA